jgi:hypothetical protein
MSSDLFRPNRHHRSAGSTITSSTPAGSASLSGVMDLLAEARQVLPEIIDLRRAIHRQPELGLDLHLTQAKVVHALRDLPLDIRAGCDATSVTADQTALKSNRNTDV